MVFLSVKGINGESVDRYFMQGLTSNIIFVGFFPLLFFKFIMYDFFVLLSSDLVLAKHV